MTNACKSTTKSILNLKMKNFRKSSQDWASSHHAEVDVFLNGRFISTYTWDPFYNMTYLDTPKGFKIFMQKKYPYNEEYVFNIWSGKVWNKSLTDKVTEKLTEKFVNAVKDDSLLPDPYDVESCLVSDAQCFESSLDFEDFCTNIGYDTDSRKAEKIYNQCQDIFCKLVRTGKWEELKKLHEED